MGKQENFTAGNVAGFKCAPGKSQTIHWDGKTPGLGLRVTAKGAKAYIFESRLHGKTLRRTIGSPKIWPLETEWRSDPATGQRYEHQRGARDEAQRLKSLCDQGIDPRDREAEQAAAIEARKAAAAAAQRAAERSQLTLGDAWPAYLRYGKTKARPKTRTVGWSAHHYNDHVRLATPGGEERKRSKALTEPGPLASLMTMPLAHLTSRKLAEWLNTEAARRPTAAAHAFRLLRAFIRWAAESEEYRGLVPEDAYSTKEVQNAIPGNQAKVGDCLEREQLKVWFAAVNKLSNAVISAYLQSLLLTGARREEMAGLQWTDVDFKWDSLKIRDKVEGHRVIPLTPYLKSLLLDLQRRNGAPPTVRRLRTLETRGEAWKPSPWVFSSPTAGGGKIREPRPAHTDALAAAGLPHLTLHGLRRSFGTLSEWTEMPSGICAQIMGHKPSAIAEKHYRRRSIDLLRLWHVKYEAWVLEQAGIQFEYPKAGVRAVTAA